jgi:tetratricopeptide (TPR) repeat protein
MTTLKKLALIVAAASTIAALPETAALAAGGGAVDMPRMPTARERTPQDLAKVAYNAGVRTVRRAQEYDEAAEKASTPEKKEKQHAKASAAYEKALSQFEEAVANDGNMHEAWNYIGYSQRHLGRYEIALQSYAQALQLKPGYPEAIEYRGEAYLGLNRLDDAREAYMQLFSGSRKLADQLLASMQKFVSQRRETPNGLDPAALDAFANWVTERAAIAQQTASLDTSRDSKGWR